MSLRLPVLALAAVTNALNSTLKKRHFSFLKSLFFGLFIAVFYISPAIATNTCLSPEQQLAEVDDWGIVAKIIDGDTIHLKDGRKIRLIGINTPELGRRGAASQAFGLQAYEALVQLLQGHNKVGLSYDKDKKDRYKRSLAYLVLPDGQSVERLLLSKGLAHSIVVPPNDRRIKCYRSIEKTARDKKLGLWRLPENQWFKSSRLSTKSKGLRYVSGTVSGYSESKKSFYLKLGSKLSIRIAKKDKKYFSTINLKKLVGRYIRVRGWVSTHKGRQSIYIRTAHDLQI